MAQVCESQIIQNSSASSVVEASGSIVFRGFTLLELLRLYAEKYVELGRVLLDLEMCLYSDEKSGRATPKTEILPSLDIAITRCHELSLSVSILHVSDLKMMTERGAISSSDVDGLVRNIERELSSRIYVIVPAERTENYLDGTKGWESIIKSFPELLTTSKK